MRLVSLIRMSVGPVLLDRPCQCGGSDRSMLLENCLNADTTKCGCWQRRHQAEAPGCEMADIPAGHRNERSDAPPVGRRRLTDSLREERAEAAKAREADLHAHVGDRVLAAG